MSNNRCTNSNSLILTHSSVTEHILWAAFADAGLIRNVRICQDAATKRSLGYGYVNFVNAADGTYRSRRPVRSSWRPETLQFFIRSPSSASIPFCALYRAANRVEWKILHAIHPFCPEKDRETNQKLLGDVMNKSGNLMMLLVVSYVPCCTCAIRNLL